jgi:sugar phosphate isomerase/epimerase
VPPDRAISLAVLTVLELPPPEMVAVAARCGYSHVGLRPIPATPGELHFPLLSDAALRRDTQSALADHGIGVLDVEILRLKPETVVEDFEAVLAFGAEFGALFALVAGNDPDLARSTDNFAALCDLAATYGISPHLEFMPWTDVPNIAVARQVAEASGNANAGVLVDAFHLNRSGGTPANIPENDPSFGYVQLCDIAGPIPDDLAVLLQQARAERLFPGDGDCDLVGLLLRLPAGIPISLEIPRDDLRAQGLSAEDCALRAIEATWAVLKAADLGCPAISA